MNSQNVSLSSKRRDPKSHPITSYNYMEVSARSWGYPKLHHPCDFQISKPSSIIQHHPAIRQHRVIRGKPRPPLAHPGCATAPAHARCRWPNNLGSRMGLPHIFVPEKRRGQAMTSHDFGHWPLSHYFARIFDFSLFLGAILLIQTYSNYKLLRLWG